MSKKIYFASPLFSEMEKSYNEKLVLSIRETYPEIDVYVPQEQGEINDKNAYADSMAIAKYDTEALLASQLMVAVLDGSTIDVGVATEIGVAYQAGIPIIGLYTDSRQQGATNLQKLAALQEVAESQFSYVNLYTVGLIKMNGAIYSTSEDFITAIKDYL
ncbi:nucleoside 2-deoxyribosyltransferase [Carnobacterium viridans]|uniref:Nucleoside 2-deoxyribosyltransferase n=1 Tax=Carnobacterium viridans TaxID=174587 RepID=A0A1H0Z2R1_9LACT|nr:nucleoside 2-deoxyribosyltransferase [Carnobacterium viridans]UDE94828.1 nucleoside 2-deoxyribosyltransferase [Carnobacterium viridans]SDQ21610.1 Nucleoside 2-deoxyribosyltransferase [Carnobacterium viridans]